MTRKNDEKTIEPFVLIDNLAQGVLHETDEGMREWAKKHNLDIKEVSGDNKLHLKRAIESVGRGDVLEGSTAFPPEIVETREEARKVITKYGAKHDQTAGALPDSGSTDIHSEVANQLLKTEKMKEK